MQRDAETMSHGAEEGTEAMDPVDSDSLLRGEESVDDEAPDKLDEPLAKLALDNIRDTIDRLYRLSFKIRNPATRLGFSKARRCRLIAEDGTDLSESVIAIDLKHVDDLMAKRLKMPPEESRNHFLVIRLAKANTTRRQQFGLWRRHGLKVEQQIDRNRGSTSIAVHNDAGTTSQQRPDTMSQPTTATKIDESIFWTKLGLRSHLRHPLLCPRKTKGEKSSFQDYPRESVARTSSVSTAVFFVLDASAMAQLGSKFSRDLQLNKY